jgi:hypothetical protein
LRHRSVQFDLYVFGLQECPAKDEWIRSLTQAVSLSSLLLPAPAGPQFGVGSVACLDPSTISPASCMPQ